MFAESGTSAKVPLGERATSLGPGALKLAAVPMPSMKPVPPPASVEVIAELAVDGGTWAYAVPNRSTHTNNLAGAHATWSSRRPVFRRQVTDMFCDGTSFHRRGLRSRRPNLAFSHYHMLQRMVVTKHLAPFIWVKVFDHYSWLFRRVVSGERRSRLHPLLRAAPGQKCAIEAVPARPAAAAATSGTNA